MGKVFVKNSLGKLKEFANTSKEGDYELIPKENSYVLREIKDIKKMVSIHS